MSKMMNIRTSIFKRRTILSAGAALFACFAVLFILAGAFRKPSTHEIQKRARIIGARNGILIGYGPPDTFFVPPYSARDSCVAGRTAKQVDISVLPPALDGIEKSLSIYPHGFFSHLCKAIFLCDSLTLEGEEAGGTYGKAWIILDATKTSGRQGVFEMARLGVHHEFSSIVWQRFPQLQWHWAALLPSGWKPVDNPLKSPDLATRAVDGFLSQYGATSAENDFNVYAEKIFTEPKNVAALAETQTVIARKISLLMAAYERLDDRMADVFNRLSLGQFRNASSNPLDEPVAFRVSPTEAPKGKIVVPAER